MPWRLQTRIVALLILVVLAAQLATFAVVHVATGRSVSSQLEEELAVAERVWQRFYEARSRQLLESTLVLADDFGFKAAVASGDAATMASAGGRLWITPPKDSAAARIIGPSSEAPNRPSHTPPFQPRRAAAAMSSSSTGGSSAIGAPMDPLSVTS